MAYRDRSTTGKPDSFDYCVMRVTVLKKGDASAPDVRTVLMTVDNHLDTIRFVQKNLEDCIDTFVRL